jgi:uncharacterized membrane protein YagU involved in acid resistance
LEFWVRRQIIWQSCCGLIESAIGHLEQVGEITPRKQTLKTGGARKMFEKKLCFLSEIVFFVRKYIFLFNFVIFFEVLFFVRGRIWKKLSQV